MIRKLILSSLSLAVIAGSYAQEKKHAFFHLSPRQVKNRQMVSNFLRNNHPGGPAHKPTAIKQRVIAQTFDYGDGSFDSTRYVYSGSNGSAYNYNNFIELTYSRDFAPEMGPAFVHPYYKPSTDVMADRIVGYTSSEFNYDARGFYTAGKLDSVHAHNIVTETDYYRKSYIDYTGAGYVGATRDYESMDDISYHPLVKREISYSGSGQVTGDSSFYYIEPEWIFNQNQAYHYDGSGYLDTLFIQGDQVVFTYDAEGRITTIKAYSLSGGEPEHYVTDSMGYTAGVGYATYFHEVFYDEDFMYATRILKYPGEGGRLDSLAVYDFDEDVWTKSGVAKYSYTSFGNPETISLEEEGETAASIRFYYEEYDDGLALPEIADSKMFSVYPNPFRNNLTISYTGKDSKAMVSWRLTDITGREIINGTLVLSQGDNKIEIPQVASGNYLLILKDESGKTRVSKLVKQ